MEQEVQKKEIVLNNESYKERFQFILMLDDNIICQRYFRINGFKPESIGSYELKEAIDEVVWLIRKDLESKSRVYQWYTNTMPMKLTGYGKDFDDMREKLPQATYFYYTGETNDIYGETERPQPYEFTFRFSFLMDDKVVYEKIWDGSEYPRYVRNSVDLTNSGYAYKDKEPLQLSFNLAVLRSMTVDKVDLIYPIINIICNATSDAYGDKKNVYTYTETYGDKEYSLNDFNDEVINKWRTRTFNRTRDYFTGLYPSQRQIDRIDNYL